MRLSPTEYIRRYISSENFFWHVIFIYNHRKLFFLPTNLAMKLGIADKRKGDERFLSMISSVKKLPTNSESETDEIFSSVKL